MARAIGTIADLEMRARAAAVDAGADDEERAAAAETVRQAVAVRRSLERWMLRRAMHAAVLT